jgi:hypothetical protein
VPRSTQEFLNSCGRSRDHRSITFDGDGPLHQYRVLQQQFNHRIQRLIIVVVQAQFFELLVVAHQITRFIGEQIEDTLELSSGQWILEVFNDIELDVSLAQYFYCAA